MNINASRLLQMSADEFSQIVKMGGVSYGFIPLSPKTNDKVNAYFKNLGIQIYHDQSLCDRIKLLGLCDFSAQGENIAVEIKKLAYQLFGVPKRDTILPTFEQIKRSVPRPSTPFETVKITWKALQVAAGFSQDRPIILGLHRVHGWDNGFIHALQAQVRSGNITPEYTERLDEVTEAHIFSISQNNLTTDLIQLEFNKNALTEEHGDRYLHVLTKLMYLARSSPLDGYRLDFRGTNIIKLHPAISSLRINCLNCSNCRFLTEVPIGLKFQNWHSVFLFSGCISLTSVPENFSTHPGFHFDIVDFSRCSRLRSFSENFVSGSIIRLDLSGCISLTALELNAREVSILDLTGCRSLLTIPRFEMRGAVNPYYEFYPDFGRWSPRIEEITLTGCTALTSMPGWPLRSGELNCHNRVVSRYVTVEEALDEYESMEISIADAWRLTLFNPASKVFDKVDPNTLPGCLRSKVARIFICVLLTIFTLVLSHLAKFFVSKNTIIFQSVKY